MIYCYFIQFVFSGGDTLSGWHDEPSYADAYYWAKHILELACGGHASIFDEDGELVGEIEI